MSQSTKNKVTKLLEEYEELKISVKQLEYIETLHNTDHNTPQIEKFEVEKMKETNNEIQNEIKQNADNNLKNVGNNKHFTTYMTRVDMDNFKKLKDANKVEEYIEQYISNHNKDGVINEEDVYSLLLNTAIVLGSRKEIEEILSSSHSKNILTQVDKTNYSPLSNALESGNQEILTLIKNYIDTNKAKIIKTQQIDKEDYDNLLTTLKFPRFEDLDPQTFLNSYLEPLYTQDCLGEIKDLVER